MIRITKDGRAIRTGVHYTTFRRIIYHMHCDERCAKCKTWVDFPDFHVHHKNGRGMGGGKRNDMAEEVLGLCGNCHRQEHGQ